MQVVPNIAGKEATGSERKVLSLLRSVDWGGGPARALNSLNLAEHAYQRWGEIDFLLVGAKGLIAIEVKGGDVTCSGGRWHYEDGVGRVVTRSKSPLVQAKDAFFSLDKNYVIPRFGAGFTMRNPAGFCVILAGMKRRELDGLLGGPEFPRELIGCADDLESPAKLQAFLESVASYWVTKNRSSRAVRDHDVRELVQMLRPEFERVQALALARDKFDQEMLALTEEQYEILDHWSGADRIFCSSPAGCGKTLIASEMVRRSVDAGASVLFLVGTDALASALRATPGISGVVLSLAEAEAMTPDNRPRSDVLVIDEGQQFLTTEGMKLLDSLVQGGLALGKWAWFGDVNYQSPYSREDIEAGISALASAASVRPRLTKNCRNTPEIITSVELAAGVPLGHAIVRGRGLPPTMSAEPDRDGAARAISRQVRAWMDEGIALGSITLLTDDPDPDRLATDIGRLGGFATGRWCRRQALGAQLAYADIDSFRGLESGFVILFLEGAGQKDDDLGRLLYLGMTRGNFALAIVATPEVLDRVHARMAGNAERHLKGE